MTSESKWQEVLNEWADIVRPFVRDVLENGVFPQDDPWCDEYRKVDIKLQGASLQEIDSMPIEIFGAIGDSICVMKHLAPLWMLPVLLRFGSLSEEPVYATSVINALRQTVCRLATWPEIKGRISADTRICLYELALLCCELGWEDERRVRKRIAESKAILLFENETN